MSTICIAGWSWIFILEGLATIVAALFSYWFIQDLPDTAKFLTEEERALIGFGISQALTLVCSGVFVIRRLQDDTKFSAAGESFKKKYVWKSLTDWKTWIASESVFCTSLVGSLTVELKWVYTWACTYP